jgi:hypothetical protein
MTDRPVREFSWAQVCARRLERQWLAAPSQTGSPADIVRAMCGAHAQVMQAAELSVGIRGAGISRADVRKALWEDGTLVRTFGPRGTVHLLNAADLSQWTGALGALPPNPALGQFLAPGQTDEIVAAIADALRDGELTADELTDAIVARTGTWAAEPVMPAFQTMWPRWRAAMGTAGFRGALCFGAGRGRASTSRSPGQLLPGFRPADAAPALGWLVRAYLQAYGPATQAHFARWLAVPREWASSLFDDHRGELAQVTVAGTPAWVLQSDTGAITREPSGVRLLPYFDSLWWPASPGSCCSRPWQVPVPWPGGRQVTIPSYLSTASSADCGTTAVPERKWRSLPNCSSRRGHLSCRSWPSRRNGSGTSSSPKRASPSARWMSGATPKPPGPVRA